jgi:hypothetical protein
MLEVLSNGGRPSIAILEEREEIANSLGDRFVKWLESLSAHIEGLSAVAATDEPNSNPEQ